MILDEAPAGLDVRSESEFYQLLYQLKREQGWAILQISHDLDMVRRHCDRVLCLNRSCCVKESQRLRFHLIISQPPTAQNLFAIGILISVQILVLPFALCRSHQRYTRVIELFSFLSCSGRWSVAS